MKFGIVPAQKMRPRSNSSEARNRNEVHPLVTALDCDIGDRGLRFQSLSSGGTSRNCFEASARSIAFSAAATALDFIPALPWIFTPVTDADHFQPPTLNALKNGIFDVLIFHL